MMDLILPLGKEPIAPRLAEKKIVELMDWLIPRGLDQIGVAFQNPQEARRKILELEHAMGEASKIQLQLKTTHRWIDGIYSREIFIPKGTLLVGRIHRHACISIMNMGDKTTISEDGAVRLKAPFATVSRPGIKRVGLAHEDTIWTTFHATKERDLKKLEDELFTDSYDGTLFEDADILTVFTNEGKICPQ